MFISGAKHIPTPPQKVYEEMSSFIDKFTKNNNLHPIERAALIHAELVRIHPFVDGNGRTARLIMNLELMKTGYPLVIIEVTDKIKYCELLDLGHTTNNYTDFVDYIISQVEKTLNIYLYAIKQNNLAKK